jgi:hypothetical protein
MHGPKNRVMGKERLPHMNASEGLWRQWSGQLRAFLPDVHGHRSKTLAFFVLGVMLAGTTRLPRVAEALVGVSAATTPSIERRLSRCLANQQIIVVPLWTRLIGHCLAFWRDRRLVFVWSSYSTRPRWTSARPCYISGCWRTRGSCR